MDDADLRELATADRAKANVRRIWIVAMETAAGDRVRVPITWEDTGGRGIAGVSDLLAEYDLDFSDCYEWAG